MLDEPEARLSLLSQIALATKVTGLGQEGIQVLMATHSPILAAAPGARIIELDETGLHSRTWNELMTVSLCRRFLADPGYFGLE